MSSTPEDNFRTKENIEKGYPKSEKSSSLEPLISNIISIDNVGIVSSNNNNNIYHTSGGGEGGVQLKKGPWTALEDAALIEYVRVHGEGNWNAVQRNSGLARCGKSCRLRWTNHLRPNLKKGAFSPEEERLIIELHSQFGNKWAKMAALLPGRTDNEVKNYWNTRVKRHQRQGIPLYPPEIQPKNQHQQTPTSPSIPLQNHHHLHYDPHSTPPTTPTSTMTPTTSSFTFQTPIPSPTNSPCNNNPTSISPLHSPLSSPTTTHTTSSFPFTFQMQQLSSPTISLHATPTSPTTTTSISSPTISTLPLFDFSLPMRTPPILVQTPLRFRRLPSFSPSTIIDATPITTVSSASNTNTNTNTNTCHFSLPLQFAKATTPPISPVGNHVPSTCLTSTIPAIKSAEDFHKEIEEENQRMCSLLADLAHKYNNNHHHHQQPAQELPSTQFLTPTSSLSTGKSLGTSTATNVITTVTTTTSVVGNIYNNSVSNKRKNIDEYQGSRGDPDHQEVFFLMEDQMMWESDDLGWARKTCRLLINQDDHEKGLFGGFPAGNCNSSSSVSLSPGLATNVEGTAQLNSSIPEDSTKSENNLLCSIMAEPFCSNREISSDPFTMATEDNDIGIETDHLISLFPTTTDYERTNIDDCSWDNLP